MWARLCLSLLIGTPAVWGAAELHVSTLGDNPLSLSFNFADRSPALNLEAPNGYVSVAHLFPEVKQSRIFVAPSEAGQQAGTLGEVSLPSSGRHLLLITHADGARSKTHIIPFDDKVHPKGGVSFLNLTSRKTRCFIEKEVVELNPGEVKLIPSISMKRRIVNHRIDVRVKDGWKQDSSTTLILGANRRFLFILQEDTPEGGLRRGLVTDFDPDRNLAPLVKAEPPVTATPPPADQPAK